MRIFSAVPALALLTLATTLLAAGPKGAPKRLKDPHSRTFWGESCLRCHAGTAGKVSEKVEEQHDVVIVGGGMSGLVAMSYLKDRDTLVLELEDEPGGQMREAEWKGIRYAVGAAYLVEPYGMLQDFYDREQVKLTKIPEPENSAWIGGKFYPACWIEEGRAHLPWKGKDMKAWLNFLEYAQNVDETSQSNQPFEGFSLEQQEIDQVSARDHMKKFGLTDEQIHHFDRYIPSCFGVESRDLSASAFMNYISGEIAGSYTFPGGMGAITRHIYERNKKRVRLGSRVTRVTQDLTGARVTYVDKAGRSHTVGARVVIMAVPQNILPWLMPDLPQRKRKVIESIDYSSYIVANVLMNEVMWDDKGYDTWIQHAYFRDIIDATWISRGGKPYEDKKQPHVLTLYIPSGRKGIWKELEEKPEVIKEKILVDLEKVIPGVRSRVEDIRISRFAHSMHVASPGFMTDVVPVLREPWYRVIFAGAEVEGLPCNESAILSGWRAAREARTWLWDGPAMLEKAAAADHPVRTRSRRNRSRTH